MSGTQRLPGSVARARFVLAGLACAVAALMTTGIANGELRHHPCGHGCHARVNASPNTKHWVSPQRLRANLKVTVKVGHRTPSVTYYRRHGELCVGYFSGF